MNRCEAPCTRTTNGICQRKVRRKDERCYAHKDVKHFSQLDIAEMVKRLYVEGMNGLDRAEKIEDHSARALATRESCRCLATMSALCKQFKVEFK